MKECYVIISGATGGIGRELAKLCISSDNVKKCVLLYKDDVKFQNIFDILISDKIQKRLYNMEDNFSDAFSLLDSSIEICEVRLVLTAFTIEPIKNIVNLGMDEITKNIKINVLSQVNLINSVMRETKKAGISLGIVNINSGAAYRALKGWALYSGAKAYINMFLKTLSEEESIKIVSYDPGVVNTAMQAIIRETDERVFNQVQQFRDYYNENKLHDPKIVASDIFWRYVVNWKAEKFKERFSPR